MKLFLSLFLAAIAFSATSASPESASVQIVGGEQADVGEYPWFAHLPNIGCGGSLIAPDVVLSAAHCGDLSGTQIVVGAYKRGTLDEGAQLVTCSQYVVDPDYDDVTNNSDYALCKLSEAVTVDTSTVTLVLNEDENVPTAGEDLKVAGMGLLETGGELSEFLMDLTQTYVDKTTCEATWGLTFTDRALCAGNEVGKDSCNGDSGGPIIKITTNTDGTIVHTLLGATSFGTAVCGEGVPAVYARVSARMDWIRTIICDEMNSVSELCGTTTASPTATPTAAPTATPTATPTASQQTATPTATPTASQQTATPTATPTASQQTATPTATPTASQQTATPTATTTAAPTAAATVLFTSSTSSVSSSATTTDTENIAPTTKPTIAPTIAPTSAPTSKPTEAPTASPTDAPTDAPTATPTGAPILSPLPTAAPTRKKVKDKNDKKNKKKNKKTAKKTKSPKSTKAPKSTE